MNPSAVEPELARSLLQSMVRARRFEEKAAELYSAGKIRGFLHLYVGEEAVAAGVLPALRADDALVATYREHGHALLRGVSARAIMAEMFGKSGGCSHGRGGSMHLFDAATRLYGGNAIVGGGLPIAVGIALADVLAGRPRVTACFFGEGAVTEGEFHESMNLASLWKLPVLFVCENNLYAMGTRIDRAQSNTDVAAKGAGYRVPAEAVDGMDVLAVREAAERLVTAIRAGGGPRLLEAKTYRFRAHSMFDPELYRDKKEVETWKKRDPVNVFFRRMKDAGIVGDPDLANAERMAAKEIDDAVAFADASPWEPVEDLAKDVYADAPPLTETLGLLGWTARRTTYREAIREALRQTLESNPSAFVMGEDIGKYGGCYAVTKGLLEEFGAERMRDTPLSESAFAGAGVGAALAGARPIVELMTVNFSLLAMDPIVNSAATIRHMSGGQFSVPLTIRMATGAGRQVAAQHSHSFEGWYAHVPGIKVLAPSTVSDAAACLLAAVRDPNPVLVFEHATLYNLEGEIDPAQTLAGVWKAAVRRAGNAATVIAYGAMVAKAVAAADAVSREDGVEVEVLDLRTLRPLDTAAIVSSVSRTHRAVVVDEGWRTAGLSAEIVATIAEGAFYALEAPVERVCTAEVPIPYPRHLEEAALPSEATIAAAIRRVVAHG